MIKKTVVHRASSYSIAKERELVHVVRIDLTVSVFTNAAFKQRRYSDVAEYSEVSGNSALVRSSPAFCLPVVGSAADEVHT
jgi:hypothetical protein